MKRIYSYDNRLIVYNLKNLLECEGIACEIRNEFAGGGVGDLATFDTWPEIWIESENDENQAMQLINDVMHNQSSSHWFCRKCHEENGSAFKVCWSCGSGFE